MFHMDDRKKVSRRSLCVSNVYPMFSEHFLDWRFIDLEHLAEVNEIKKISPQENTQFYDIID